MFKHVRAMCLAGALLAATAALAAPQEIAADSIRIGAFGPISGPASYIGLAGRDGATLAFNEINAAGGINGRRIKLDFEDDGHSPSRALAAVKKLVEQDRVFLLMSVGGSNATAGTVEYVKQQGVPMYVSISSAPAVTYPFAKTLFRGGTTETERYGELYAEFLKTRYGAKRIAILAGREEYPRNEGDATTTKLKEWFGIAPVARLDFNIGDKDFTPQLTAAHRASPDVIAFFGNPAETAIAIRQARDLGLTQPFFVGTTMVDPSFAQAARGAAEGVMGFSLVPYLPGSQAPAMAAWEQKWRKAYPGAPVGRPNIFDVLAYSDAYVIAEGLRKAGPQLSAEGFVKALESVQGYRVGDIATPRSFSPVHHIGNLTLVPMMIKGGTWQLVDWKSTHPSDILNRYK